ncbi:MAG: N-acetyltransferase family protein [Acidimicrobiia bacterium]
MTEPGIRRATAEDLDAITRIYDQYIVGSAVSFDVEPWPRERRLRWWEDHQGHPRLVVLVAEEEGEVVGVAYSSWYRPKVAYERSMETSIVLDGRRTGQGLGPRLYGALLDELAAAGTHRAYAVVTIPNEASIALHHRLGFRDVGVEDECGWKLGRWWSTLTLEKRFDDA